MHCVNTMMMSRFDEISQTLTTAILMIWYKNGQQTWLRSICVSYYQSLWKMYSFIRRPLYHSISHSLQFSRHAALCADVPRKTHSSFYVNVDDENPKSHMLPLLMRLSAISLCHCQLSIWWAANAKPSGHFEWKWSFAIHFPCRIRMNVTLTNPFALHSWQCSLPRKNYLVSSNSYDRWSSTEANV